jgi:hypothetical protein
VIAETQTHAIIEEILEAVFFCAVRAEVIFEREYAVS